MRFARKRRRVPGINTASIADISFTLLILFLVVTSMDDDNGMSRMLPPLATEQQPAAVTQRNVLRIVVSPANVITINDDSLTKSPAMMKHIGGAIQDETKRLRFLVEKVLQMSMFDKKDAIFKKKELDLNEMIENVANTFTLRVEHTGGKIITDIEAVDSKCYVDEMHFTNVIFNLIDNAIKYRKPDQPVNLFIKTWNTNDHLCFSIKDDGVGIKKDNLKKIFEKFYRVHTGNLHDVKGFGLGLAYVKKMVDLHKGDIKVESELGKGTKFTILLPIIKE